MSTLVLIDNELMPLAQAKVGVNDRSFLFGDSVYEVIATRKGHPYFSADHFERLRQSAAGIYMEIPWDNAWFEQRIRQGLDVLQLDSAYLRIMVSRGAGEIDIALASVKTGPQAVFIFKPAPDYSGRFVEEGFKLAVPTTRRSSVLSLNPAFKTGNYLNNILCLEEARRLGADDALILGLDGSVTELSTSNFFLVKDGELWTSPLDVGILDGITRRYLIQIAKNLGIPCHCERFPLAAVLQADEAFVSSSVKGAMPVYQVDQHLFPAGYGPITAKINQAYWDYVDQHLDHY